MYFPFTLFANKDRCISTKKGQNRTPSLFCKFADVPDPHILGVLTAPPPHLVKDPKVPRTVF